MIDTDGIGARIVESTVRPATLAPCANEAAGPSNAAIGMHQVGRILQHSVASQPDRRVGTGHAGEIFWFSRKRLAGS